MQENKKDRHVLREQGKKSDEDGMYGPGREPVKRGKYVGGYLSWEVSGYSHGFDAPVLGSKMVGTSCPTLTGNRRGARRPAFGSSWGHTHQIAHEERR